jgi:hypothetical protein
MPRNTSHAAEILGEMLLDIFMRGMCHAGQGQSPESQSYFVRALIGYGVLLADMQRYLIVGERCVAEDYGMDEFAFQSGRL